MVNQIKIRQKINNLIIYSSTVLLLAPQFALASAVIDCDVADSNTSITILNKDKKVMDKLHFGSTEIAMTKLKYCQQIIYQFSIGSEARFGGGVFYNYYYGINSITGEKIGYSSFGLSDKDDAINAIVKFVSQEIKSCCSK
jgi:hypothetical protein